MREILGQLLAMRARGEDAAMMTVTRTWQSAPRPAGASMLLGARGEAVGSVSGGCVEGALVGVGELVLEDGQPRYETYGISDDDAFSVGLTCGGILEVFAQRVDAETWPDLSVLAQSVTADEPVAVATIVRGPHSVGAHLIVTDLSVTGSLGSDRLDDTVRDDARGLLAAGKTGFLTYGESGERLGVGLDVFVESMAPAPSMLIFGAIDFAAALCRAGKLLGYRVTVCDARPLFATAKRFPDADAVVVDWPHRWLATQRVEPSTVIAVLTHDPKFDVPVLKEALRSDAGYIGAMGSRRTHLQRADLLRAEGITEDELARLHSPIGLDLGARTPEETAISIAAEIVQHRWGGTGLPLAKADGPIHASEHRRSP